MSTKNVLLLDDTAIAVTHIKQGLPEQNLFIATAERELTVDEQIMLQELFGFKQKDYGHTSGKNEPVLTPGIYMVRAYKVLFGCKGQIA